MTRSQELLLGGFVCIAFGIVTVLLNNAAFGACGWAFGALAFFDKMAKVRAS